MKQPTNNYKKAILAFTTGFINYRNCISTETKRLFIAITIARSSLPRCTS